MQGLQRLEKLRLELKTYLNHIIGYAEILKTDAIEYGRSAYLGGLESITSKADKVRRLISFFLDPENEIIDEATSEDVKKAFFVPLMQIITDTRRLIVQFRRNDSNFIPDAEQILSVANQMLQLVEEEIVDIQLEELYVKSEVREDASVPTVTSERENDGYVDIPAFSDFDFEEEFQGEKAKNPGIILLVDDSSSTRLLIGRHLKALGHTIIEAESGERCLEILNDHSPDLIILDVLMPDMTGYHVLRELKHDDETREIPVIMLSAIQNSDSIAQCIKMGAEDYLPKDYEPSILKARIDASIEKRVLQKEREKFTTALITSQNNLAKELSEAAAYITNQLPAKLEGNVESSLYFKPSAQLGGDFINHLWLDDDNLCLFILDASGHGIRSSLMAISISHLINTGNLQDIDFHKPEDVLSALNRHFQIDVENPNYFTLWYGVYNISSRTLSYSSAGAPPAIHLRPRSGDSPEVSLFGSEDIIIGALDDSEYQRYDVPIESGDRLFLVSDGTFEVTRKNGKMLGMDELIELIRLTPGKPSDDTQLIVTQLEALALNDSFEDDISIMELKFY